TTLPRPADLPQPPRPPAGDVVPAPLPNILPPATYECPPAFVATTWGPCGPACGLTAAIEFGFLQPHLKNALVAPVLANPGGFIDIVSPPTSQLDFTVAPRSTIRSRP